MMNNPTNLITFSPVRPGESHKSVSDRRPEERDLFRQMVDSAQKRRDRNSISGEDSRQTSSEGTTPKESVQEKPVDTEEKRAGQSDSTVTEEGQSKADSEQKGDPENSANLSGVSEDATDNEESGESPSSNNVNEKEADSGKVFRPGLEEEVTDKNRTRGGEQQADEKDESGQELRGNEKTADDRVNTGGTTDSSVTDTSNEKTEKAKVASSAGHDGRNRGDGENLGKSSEHSALKGEGQSAERHSNSEPSRKGVGSSSEENKVSGPVQEQKSHEKNPLEKKVVQGQASMSSSRENQQKSLAGEKRPDSSRQLESEANSRSSEFRSPSPDRESAVGRPGSRVAGVLRQDREPAVDTSKQSEHSGVVNNGNNPEQNRMMKLPDTQLSLPGNDAGMAMSGDLAQKVAETVRASRRDQLRNERQVKHLQAFGTRLQPESRPVRFNPTGGLSGEPGKANSFHFLFDEGQAGTGEDGAEPAGEAKALWREHLTEFDENPESKPSDTSAAGTVRLGQVTIANISIRKHVLGPLSQAVQQTAGGEKSQGESWQKHSIVLDDGKKIDLLAKRVDGVLQLRLGSSNQELNQLLMQHQQEIRQHLERECGLRVELQFTGEEQSSSEQAFEEALAGSSRNRDGSRQSVGDHAGHGHETEKSGRPEVVRSFGYNRMEWTA